MSHKIAAVLLGITFLLGVFLFGEGMTGYVISESCCYSLDCEFEDICGSAKTELQSPAEINHNSLYIGGMLVLITLFLYVILHRNH